MSINYAFAAELPSNNNYWKKLLHYNADKSRVISNEFFISQNGNINPAEELKTTVNLLKGDKGNIIACNYPARYLWIRKSLPDIPFYNLKQCPELVLFMDQFQKDRIDIVFASEFLNVPSSSFGHIMLVFHDDTQPYLTANTIHFAAETNNENFFRYAFNGINGDFNGYFLRSLFFKKKYEYNILEQRYLHRYTLDFDKAKIKNLLYHLFELRKATFKYYFIKENCAYQIAILLDIAQGNPETINHGLYVLPIDVIKYHEKSIIKKEVSLPTVIKTKELIETMNKYEKMQFQSVISNKLDPNIVESDKVIESLINYYEYNFRRYNHIFDNYETVMSLKHTKSNLNHDIPEPLERDAPSKIGIGLYGDSRKNGIYLQYRPFLRDVYDIQKDTQQESELNLFNLDLIAYTDEIKIEELNIISIKSLSMRSKFFTPYSWMFFAGANRDNTENSLNFETEFGFGATTSISTAIVNYTLNSGIDVTENELYLKPELSLTLYISSNIKFGLSSSYKYYNDHHYIQSELFMTYRLSDLTIQTRYKSNNSDIDKKIIVMLNYYF